MVSAKAQEYYEAAIKASYDQWGLSEDKYKAFIKNVKYDATNWKKSIGTQKWVALFLQGGEAWAEWRRLDYPKLIPPAEHLNKGGGIPLRFGYPTIEQSLNGDNYKLAVKSIGGKDDLNTKVWWDKN